MRSIPMDITPDEAKVTTTFPIPPDEVVAAYRRTGLLPVRGEWFIRGHCACAAGALVHDQLPAGVSGASIEDITRCFAETTSATGEHCHAYIDEFSVAFDRTSTQRIREDVMAHGDWSGHPGWFILAWRNALAVREAMDAADLTPCLTPCDHSSEDYEA